jgi:endonuclease/exonuclease/phosphatase family metal-dependent hydrolase
MKVGVSDVMAEQDPNQRYTRLVTSALTSPAIRTIWVYWQLTMDPIRPHMRVLLTASLLLTLTSNAAAQFTESFESSAKGGYAAGTVELPSGTWYLEEALIGNLANDVKKSGAFSVRMGSVGAKLQMQFNVDGIGELSFWHAVYAGDSSREPAVFQVQKSTNGGVTWQNVGTPITASTSMTQVVVPIQQPGIHRFQFVVITGSPAGTRNRRVNIDDLRVTNYVQVSENPAITVEVNGAAFPSGSTAAFDATAPGQSRSTSLLIRNTGNQILLISNASFTGTAFSLSEPLSNVSIASLATRTVNILYNPTALTTYIDTLKIQSNDPATPLFNVRLNGATFDASDVIPISQARGLPLGTLVTVSGWITVGNEFEGPSYFQDGTAGLAAFWPALHTAVQDGDSVVVTGPLGEFGNTPGIVGDGIRQISVPSGSGQTILFTVHPAGRKVQEPKSITVSQLNAGGHEGQLVELSNVTIFPYVNLQPGTTPFTGAFQQNTNYALRDGSGNVAQLRIDNNTNLVGATAPTGPISVVGVIGRFRGAYQILPRSTRDLEAEVLVIPFENVPKDKTFDAVTWNIEWFGAAGNGPADLELQFTNVLRVIRTIDADLYALQEISNNAQFRRLVDSLDGFRGFIAPYSQTQKTAYLYRTSVIDSLSAGYATESGQWGGGRFPFFFLFNATVDGRRERVRAINIHAKAFATQEDYNSRLSDSQILKSVMDELYVANNTLLLGDFNDDVTFSTFNSQVSPYANFVQDPNYKVISKSLSDRGQTSYSSFSNIDHIVANANMARFHLDGTERIENVSYVGNYLSTTSDHFPVWTRFAFNPVTSVDEPDGLPEGFELLPNYPNPFNPTTRIRWTLDAGRPMRLSIFDILGREVAVLVDGVMSAGSHQATFDATGLSSGVYIVRLSTALGSQTRRMLLVK